MKWLVLMLLVVSCGVDVDRNPYEYVAPTTLDRIYKELAVLANIKDRTSWNTELIEAKVREELNENKICKEVLAKLKKLGESMTEPAWKICDTTYPVVLGRFLEIRTGDE